LRKKRKSRVFVHVAKFKNFAKMPPLVPQGVFRCVSRFRKAMIFRCSGFAVLWYYSTMNYTPPKPDPESIAARLARSEAQIAAGQTVPLELVLDRLRASIARMTRCKFH
jgi:hypothetical protein